jgi:hypothetical protein
MAGGGLMQLVAYGAQDVYLTANPQITFFKQLYRRHSNFAVESIEQTFNGVASFGKRVTCTIARNGDLITRMYVEARLPAIDDTIVEPSGGELGGFTWIPFIGQYLIRSVEIEIGGQRIDKHYGDWLHIWNELTLPAGKARNYMEMVNGIGGIPYTDVSSGCTGCVETGPIRCTNAFLAANGTDCTFETNDNIVVGPCAKNAAIRSISKGCVPEFTLHIPLEFWFNRHVGLALPLIALQYHEVKINVEFNDARSLFYVDVADKNIVASRLNARGLVACSLYVDYVYLDTEERRRFAQVAHEYLIEQLQFTGEETVTSIQNKIKLSFNHPVKELIWVVQNPNFISCDENCQAPYCYTDFLGNNPVAVAKIQLNGHDRFSEREGSYFNRVQPYQHHTGSPSTGINVFSFALNPEDHQPSGTCNFSRIDNAVLNLTLTRGMFEAMFNDEVVTSSSALVRVYATNYNVLRIMSGMGGLAYSN